MQSVAVAVLGTGTIPAAPCASRTRRLLSLESCAKFASGKIHLV